jgi:hypothetical protein
MDSNVARHQNEKKFPVDAENETYVANDGEAWLGILFWPHTTQYPIEHTSSINVCVCLSDLWMWRRKGRMDGVAASWARKQEEE